MDSTSRIAAAPPLSTASDTDQLTATQDSANIPPSPRAQTEKPQMEFRLTPDGRRILVAVPPKADRERLP